MKLSRERILDAALAVVEGEGWDALSMRRLAQELDVWPMAVYRYFRDKEELLEAIVDAAAGEVRAPDGSGSWREEISDLLAGARSALRRYTATGIPLERVLLTPSGLRMSEAAVGILAHAGLEPDEAARAWRALFAYAVGAPPLTAGESDDAIEYGLERLLDGLEARMRAAA